MGKALEDDQAFWGHDTWDEDALDNESFHDSDEDGDLRRDQFDSDFDDSESEESDAAGEAAGAQAERDLMEEDRRHSRIQKKRQRQSSYVDITRQAKELLKGKKKKTGKRPVGDGVNAGIVLKVPGSTPVPSVAISRPPVTKAADARTEVHMDVAARAKPGTLASTRTRRSTSIVRTGHSSDSVSRVSTVDAKESSLSVGRSERPRLTQQQMLIEAANSTEPDNQRWILARKRNKDSQDVSETGSRHQQPHKIVLERMVSRRGALTTITFPEMDHIPEIFEYRSEKPAPSRPLSCAVTGDPARYKDPLTGLGYSTVDAFREIRRRHASQS